MMALKTAATRAASMVGRKGCSLVDQMAALWVASWERLTAGSMVGSTAARKDLMSADQTVAKWAALWVALMANHVVKYTI